MSNQPDEQIIVIRGPCDGYSVGSQLQEFTDRAITDPARLAETAKKSRRPVKRPPWFWPVVFAGAVTAALIVGILLGRFVR
jgi:hypothetical protein